MLRQRQRQPIPLSVHGDKHGPGIHDDKEGDGEDGEGLDNDVCDDADRCGLHLARCLSVCHKTHRNPKYTPLD